MATLCNYLHQQSGVRLKWLARWYHETNNSNFELHNRIEQLYKIGHLFEPVYFLQKFRYFEIYHGYSFQGHNVSTTNVAVSNSWISFSCILSRVATSQSFLDTTITIYKKKHVQHHKLSPSSQTGDKRSKVRRMCWPPLTTNSCEFAVLKLSVELKIMRNFEHHSTGQPTRWLPSNPKCGYNVKAVEIYYLLDEG